jgi:twitching motility two-component system response regulator PilH
MGKVMVADDAAAVLKVMEDILRIAGYEVGRYDSADQIEDRIAEERPDLLLLDIVMPNRTGNEALRGVKKDRRTRHTPVVFVSANLQESDWALGKSQGVADYLPKPFSPEELLTMVRQFVPDGEEYAGVGAAPACSVTSARSEMVPSFFVGLRSLGSR